LTDTLRARGVTVRYGTTRALADVDVDVARGQVVAVVGASGSGKSSLLGSLVGLCPASGVIVSDRGEARLGSAAALGLRGDVLALVPQDGAGALDPTRTVGAQIAEASRRGRHQDRPPTTLLEALGLTPAGTIAASLPDALSGGMAQRAALAVVLARGSRFVLVDEPTTGLDPVRAVEVMQTLRAVAARGAGVLLVSHDLRLLARHVDEVIVLDRGEVVERLSGAALAAGAARHPTTRSLWSATAQGARAAGPRSGAPVLEADRLRRTWATPAGPRVALDDVSLRVDEGVRVGVIGASGSGKSTLLRCCAGLERPDSGQLSLFGARTAGWTAASWSRVRRRVQWLPQEPAALLNPGLSLSVLLAETATIHRPGERPRDVVAAMLAAVGLEGRGAARPHELSGGERRRAAVARVLATRPSLVLADEPTAALDPVRARDVMALLCARLPADAALVLVSHDLPLVASTCEEVVVLDAGRVVERRDVDALRAGPAHPVTAALRLAAGMAT
jgi:peptide/nickel transport system ATP-binding protein